MKRVLLLSAACALLVACQDQPSPTAAKLSALISDGAHQGNTHFYFLPPMVPQPSFSGVFNPGLEPVVQICELSSTGCSTIASFTTTTGPGSETVRISGDLYIVNWHTAQFNLDASKTYRIVVIVGTNTLGFADVDVVTSGNQLKNVNTGQYVPLLDDRTLPIKFRIERGALTSSGDCTDCAEQTVGPAGGTVITNTSLAGAFFPPNALPQDVTVIIEHDASTPCLPIDLVQRGGCYHFRTDPGPTVFRVDVTAGICVETEGLSIAEQRLLHLHKLDFEGGEAVVTPLENVSAAFLPCDEPIPPPIGLTPIGRGVLGLATAGWHQFVRLVMPTPLSAAHVGAGGLTGSFSRIGWALPAQMTIQAGDGQTAAASTAVLTPPSVILKDSSGAPVAGETVTFSVGLGGGSITDAVATTGTDGIATVGSWTLGGAPGTNTLIAISVGAVGSPLTFTATSTTSPDLVISSTLTASPLEVFPGNQIQLSAWTIANQGGDLNSASGVIRNGFYLSTDSTITAADVLLDNNSNTNGVLQAGQSFQWGAPTLTIPANTAPGTYYIGILVDDLNQAVETNESNNFQSVKITVLSTPG